MGEKSRQSSSQEEVMASGLEGFPFSELHVVTWQTAWYVQGHQQGLHQPAIWPDRSLGQPKSPFPHLGSQEGSSVVFKLPMETWATGGVLEGRMKKWNFPFPSTSQTLHLAAGRKWLDSRPAPFHFNRCRFLYIWIFPMLGRISAIRMLEWLSRWRRMGFRAYNREEEQVTEDSRTARPALQSQ